MTSNPLAESRLGFDLFSLIIVPLLSSKIDASQPCDKNQVLKGINYFLWYTETVTPYLATI